MTRIRANILICFTLFAVGVGILAAPCARAQSLVADLSSHLVSVTAGFAGTDLLLFGSVVDEGDVIDLWDRSFEVLHLPGHSAGSIGLWEQETGILFSGDAIYDGPLLDGLEDSSIPDYIGTMERLRELPVRVVHAGHDPSFGRTRLIELVDAYLERRA